MNKLTPAKRGFTLIELLAVVAIIGLILAVAVPMVSNRPTSVRISGDADTLQGQINYARTLAIAKSQPCEIRFYELPLPGLGGRDEVFRAYQVMLYDPVEEMFMPDGRITNLEGDNFILPDATYSSLAGTDRINTAGDPNATSINNRAAEGLPYFSITFNPDGSTNLSKGGTDIWFLTIADFREAARATGDDLPSANFVTLQIDPFNGTTRRFAPGL